jgi:hypothetical protein
MKRAEARQVAEGEEPDQGAEEEAGLNLEAEEGVEHQLREVV